VRSSASSSLATRGLPAWPGGAQRLAARGTSWLLKDQQSVPPGPSLAAAAASSVLAAAWSKPLRSGPSV
jgi:hypothetical protein